MLIDTQQGEINLLALHSLSPQRYPFLLESVTHSAQSRYSLLFAYPQEHIQVQHHSEIDFLNTFDQAFTQAQQSTEYNEENSLNLPFTGGWFVYLAYELAQQIEPSLILPEYTFQNKKAEKTLPIAYAARIPVAIIIDHQLYTTHIVCENSHHHVLTDIQQDIQQLSLSSSNKKLANIALEQLYEDTPTKYLNDIDTIRAYIQAGDVFQVNYSRLWQAKTQEPLNPQQIYAVLRQRNPAPFAALCIFEDWAIISSSPERLVRVNKQIVETRPIAGTRPRSSNTEADLALLDELIQHPKERAEHIMLIDLERNDLGRICQAGSIEVDELMGLESYQHVHHIVSNIRGRLREGITVGEVIKAVFPGGTITGCPKIRCMEIIAELEQTGRGAYTGSVGYINHNGDMDFNILIRTLTQVDETQLQFRTGAGIVFDSIADNELTETRHKAKGLLKVFDL